MDERERLGRLVRDTWIKWAQEQPDPKPSWLTSWEELDEGQREVDMRIGEAVIAKEREVRRLIYARYKKLRAELAEMRRDLERAKSDCVYWQEISDGVSETVAIAERVIEAVKRDDGNGSDSPVGCR